MASIYSVSQVNAYIKNMFSQDFALNRISSPSSSTGGAAL